MLSVRDMRIMTGTAAVAFLFPALWAMVISRHDMWVGAWVAVGVAGLMFLATLILGRKGIETEVIA